MKSATRPSTRRASRVSSPTIPKSTVTLEIDQIQLDQLMTHIESLGANFFQVKCKYRGEGFIAEAVSFCGELIEADADESGLAFELIKQAPIYRALLALWHGSPSRQVATIEHSHHDDPDLRASLALAACRA